MDRINLCADGTGSSIEEIKYKLLHRKNLTEAKQSLITKSHQETMFTDDKNPEDLVIALEQKLNHFQELLLFLKQTFLKSPDSFDQQVFLTMFTQAWPVCIEVYSHIFPYVIQCFIRIFTKDRNILLMTEFVQGCFDSFFMKSMHNSFIPTFNTCHTSFRKLSDGLMSLGERVMKNFRRPRFPIPKISLDSQSVYSWSSKLFSISVPSHMLISKRSLYQKNKGICKSKKDSNLKRDRSISENAQLLNGTHSEIKSHKSMKDVHVLNGEDKPAVKRCRPMKKDRQALSRDDSTTKPGSKPSKVLNIPEKESGPLPSKSKTAGKGAVKKPQKDMKKFVSPCLSK